MDTTQLKNYAPAARRAFIDAVTGQAAKLGVTAKAVLPAKADGDILLIAGQAFPKSIETARNRLVSRIEAHGFEPTMDAIAYTWFNRFAAIRYMELHGYFDHGYRVLSHPEGHPHPEVLDNATDLALPGLDQAKVIELKLDGTQDERLYRLILIAQCQALHHAMPFLFELDGEDSETTLLLPDTLLHSDSLIRQLVESIDEELWQDIEVVGWLYQFYISERKDAVIGKVVKSEDIPAATQLFTPNWIVKYLVQNSLGAQWLATYPDSPLRSQMDYYIEPAKQTNEVLAQLAAVTPDTLNPEELTLIDPACGSGHILVEAYDLFKAIYLERGYRQRDVAKLILEKNLYGLDIDRRAAQLTGFALMMKGRADDRRLFERDVKLNVMALQDSRALDVELLGKSGLLEKYGLKLGELGQLKSLFEYATTFGSLIQVPEDLAKQLPALKQLSEVKSQDLFVSKALKHLKPLVEQAGILAGRYDAVVANPPYMGSKYHIPLLKKFLRAQYQGYDKDVFTAFIERNLSFTHKHGRLGFMTPFVWMFIASYESLRERLISEETITSLIQLEYSGFEGATVPICAFTLRQGHIANEKGGYIRLSGFRGAENQAPKTLEAINNRSCGWFYEASQGAFKQIPGSPIAYWISSKMQATFTEADALGEHMPVCLGITTADNAQFLRYWHEVPEDKASYGMKNREEAKASGKKWFPYNKGGEFRKWFGNNDYLVNWSDDGHEIRVFGTEKGGKPRASIRNSQYYFRPSITWSFISSAYFGVRYSDAGALFDVGGSSVFPEPEDHLWATGFLCSKQVFEFMKAMNPTLNFQVGNVAALPLLKNQVLSYKPAIERGVKRLIDSSRVDWDSFERSWNFKANPLIATNAHQTTIEASYQAWIKANQAATDEMKQLEEENNRLFIEAYGLEEELTPDVPIEQVTLTVNPAYRYGVKGSEEERWERFSQDTVEELISYAIGCMMGRYSLDEPGLIYAESGSEGFGPTRYRTFPADGDGIIPITDTKWFEGDAGGRLEEFLATAWDEAHLEENLDFVASNLKPKRNEASRETIRRWLCDKFFKDHHLKRYNNRPIYWLFSSGRQKAFQALVYLHRYHEGTLARMRSEYVIPLQGKMAARLETLRDDIQAANSTSHRKRLEKEAAQLEKQELELRAFDEKLRHYADRRIHLDLDDGVKVNYGKFGDLLAEVRAIHGKKPEVL